MEAQQAELENIKELPSHSGEFGEPPLPSVELPEKEGDKAYASKDSACQACKFHGTSSCAMYKTCVCFSVNVKAFGATSGGFGMAGSDNDDWHFTCNGDTIGDMYTRCFPDTGADYVDNFGDKCDPNNPICP